MRRTVDSEKGQPIRPDPKFDSDRHPTLKGVLSRILKDGNLPDVQVQRVEIHATGGGEVAYRWLEPGSDEAEGGFLPQP